MESGDPITQGGVLVSGVLELVSELVVVAGEFVDAGGQVGGAESVELLAELVAQGVAKAITFLTEVFDLLACELEFRAQPCDGGVRGAGGVAVALVWWWRAAWNISRMPSVQVSRVETPAYGLPLHG
ncbi:hypothetical protein ACFU6I_34545 [Streptomyces sp. NPDC057486]|uniref:hypothetical protein n=1 Tax=Streptomyces sp. NPDC057486 TaxID=3346145 RepID=UPI003690D3DD